MQGKKLPKGFLKDIRIGTTAKPEIALRYISNEGSETLIEFEDQDVMAALLAYCKQSNIPMSVKATKSLEIKDGIVGMFCTLNFKISNENDKLSYSDQHTNSMKEEAKAATATHAAKPEARPSPPPPVAVAAKPSPAAIPAAAKATADNGAAARRKLTELD